MAPITDDPGFAFAEAADPSRTANTCLLVLNQPILCKEAFRRCYSRAAWRIYADGGANRVRDIEGGKHQELFPPDVIIGDLDSLRRDTRVHYQSSQPQAAIVCRDHDQYSTDFGKSVKMLRALQQSFSSRDELSKHAQSRLAPHEGSVIDVEKLLESFPSLEGSVRAEKNVGDVLVVGGLGGRVDQGIGLLSQFAREEEANEGHLRFWLVSERSISWILNSTSDLTTQDDRRISKQDSRHVVQLSPQGETSSGTGPVFTPNVGILPLFCPARISTKGLEWDVEDWETSMTGQISTSNHVVSKDGVVEIANSEKVLFTVEMGQSLLGDEEA